MKIIISYLLYICHKTENCSLLPTLIWCLFSILDLLAYTTGLMPGTIWENQFFWMEPNVFCGYFGDILHRNVRRFDKQTNEPVSHWRWPSLWLVNISIIFLGNITEVLAPGLTRWDETPAEINLFLVFCVWQVFTNNHDQRARPSLDLYWSLPNFLVSKKVVSGKYIIEVKTQFHVWPSNVGRSWIIKLSPNSSELEVETTTNSPLHVMHFALPCCVKDLIWPITRNKNLLH